MPVILGIVGFFIGLFVWAQIIYPLLLALPEGGRLKRKGLISHIPLARIFIPVIVGGAVLVILGQISSDFIAGSLAALVIILLQIRNPKNKQDMVENIFRHVKIETMRETKPRYFEVDEDIIVKVFQEKGDLVGEVVSTHAPYPPIKALDRGREISAEQATSNSS